MMSEKQKLDKDDKIVIGIITSLVIILSVALGGGLYSEHLDRQVKLKAIDAFSKAVKINHNPVKDLFQILNP